MQKQLFCFKAIFV